MIYIVIIFMVTMQVCPLFPNITNKVKKKMCGPCVSFEILYYQISNVVTSTPRSDVKYLFFIKKDNSAFQHADIF